jgi:uncharacterized protein
VINSLSVETLRGLKRVNKWLLLLLLLSTLASAEVISSEEIHLLAMMENNAGKSGTVATLQLELRPGSERVYLETFPMTKVTTQASLRFAQQIACKELDVDCSKYDFLFTIHALPGIVGGPSAGSAATILTSAVLLNKSVPSNIAMTGTINSGGTIGPVGGLKYKVEAAANNGVDTVFLPTGTTDLDEENKTLDIVEYGRELNLSIVQVSTLDEILESVFEIPRDSFDEELVIDSKYQQTMKAVSEDLCSRSEEVLALPLESNMTLAANFTDRAIVQKESGAYYAAASFCFRANVAGKSAWYREQNLTNDEIAQHIIRIKKDADKLKDQINNRSISTLTDLQTYMAVMERIDEAVLLVKDTAKKIKNNSTVSASNVGYAEERLFSAVTWSRFFNGEDKIITIDEDAIKQGCAVKISEAEERYNFVKSVIPDALSATRKDIDNAHADLRDGNYIMCLYGAAKAKAEANVLLNVMGVKEEQFDDLISLKLDVARQSLIKAQRKNIFPIIAYSYFEYAKSLRGFDRGSALLFAEYALELSNLDIYFSKEKTSFTESYEVVVPPELFYLLIGVGLGGLIVWIFRRPENIVEVKTFRLKNKVAKKHSKRRSSRKKKSNKKKSK